MKTDYVIAVAGTGYVGLSNSVILSQNNKVFAVDIIDEKVKLQNASKVRSLNGILTHIWGKLSAFMLVFSNTFYL